MIKKAELKLYRRLRKLIKYYNKHPLFDIPDSDKMSKMNFKDMQEHFNMAIDKSINISDRLKKDREEIKELIKDTDKSFALWCGSTARNFVENPNGNYFMDTEMAKHVFPIPLKTRLSHMLDKLLGRELSKKGIQIYGKSFGEYVSDLSVLEVLMMHDTVDAFFKYPEVKEKGILVSKQTFMNHVELPILKKMYDEGLIQGLNILTPCDKSDKNSNRWKVEHKYDFNSPDGGIYPFETIDYHGEHIPTSLEVLEAHKISKIFESFTQLNPEKLKSVMDNLKKSKKEHSENKVTNSSYAKKQHKNQGKSI